MYFFLDTQCIKVWTLYALVYKNVSTRIFYYQVYFIGAYMHWRKKKYIEEIFRNVILDYFIVLKIICMQLFKDLCKSLAIYEVIYVRLSVTR